MINIVDVELINHENGHGSETVDGNEYDLYENDDEDGVYLRYG